MTLEFPINVNEYEDEGSHEPNIATGESKSIYTRPSFAGTSENEYARGFPHECTDTSEKQGKYAKKLSSSVDEKREK